MAKYEELIQLCIYKSLLYPEQAFYSVSAKIRGSKTKRHRFQICGQNQRRQWPECMAFLMGGSRWSAAWMPWLWQRWVLRSLERWKPRTERGKEKRRRMKANAKCCISRLAPVLWWLSCALCLQVSCLGLSLRERGRERELNFLTLSLFSLSDFYSPRNLHLSASGVCHPAHWVTIGMARWPTWRHRRQSERPLRRPEALNLRSVCQPWVERWMRWRERMKLFERV